MKKNKGPSITFVGGKYYDENGKQVPKPQKPVQATGQFVIEQVQGQSQRYSEEAVLERLAGCICTKPQETGHVPGCVHFAGALYVCERGGRETVAALARLAETTISDLQRRRVDFSTFDNPTNGPRTDCPDHIPQTDGRRRCWRCPYWTRHPDETPFDHQSILQGELP